ncbi:hypothetical protein FQZ97_983900 [compost metagenome]
MRISGPCITLLLPLALMRATSCSGTGSITSTWPESKAATRVESLPTGVYSTLTTLPSILPQ